MTARFELQLEGTNVTEIRFVAPTGEVLLRSTRPVAYPRAALSIVAWLRAALVKDWRYQLYRTKGRRGPQFRLVDEHQFACESPVFTSSDAMERAIAQIKAACVTAPIRCHSPDRRTPDCVQPVHRVERLLAKATARSGALTEHA
jgi:hypothetical protein